MWKVFGGLEREVFFHQRGLQLQFPMHNKKKTGGGGGSTPEQRHDPILATKIDQVLLTPTHKEPLDYVLVCTLILACKRVM